jgi:hypothetical protein
MCHRPLRYVKALPLEERTPFIVNAINEGDKATVAAILHAQPFLSGLTNLAHSNMRKQAAANFAPLDYAQHEAAPPRSNTSCKQARRCPRATAS